MKINKLKLPILLILFFIFLFPEMPKAQEILPETVNIDINFYKQSPVLKELSVVSQGSHFVAIGNTDPLPQFLNNESLKNKLPEFLKIIGLQGLRYYPGRFGLLEEQENKAIFATYKMYTQDQERELRNYPFVSINDFIRNTLGNDGKLDKNERIMFVGYASFGYDEDTKKGFHVMEDTKKYIPLIAKRNRMLLEKIKAEFGMDIFKNLYIEIGNEEYFFLEPEVYAEVFYASALEMQKVVPDIKLGVNLVPEINGIHPVEKSQLLKTRAFQTKLLPDFYQTNDLDQIEKMARWENSRVLKKLRELNKNREIEANISGLQIHLYNYKIKNEVLNSVRKEAVSFGFSEIPFWISEHNMFGNWGLLKALDWKYPLDYLKITFEMSIRKDVQFVDIHKTPDFGFADFQWNGIWAMFDRKIINSLRTDPFLLVLDQDVAFWRSLTTGTLQRIMKELFYQDGKIFKVKEFFSNQNGVMIIGVSEDNNLKGFITNNTAGIKNVSLLNGQEFQIIELQEPIKGNYLFDFITDRENISELEKNMSLIGNLAESLRRKLEKQLKEQIEEIKLPEVDLWPIVEKDILNPKKNPEQLQQGITKSILDVLNNKHPDCPCTKIGISNKNKKKIAGIIFRYKQINLLQKNIEIYFSAKDPDQRRDLLRLALRNIFEFLDPEWVYQRNKGLNSQSESETEEIESKRITNEDREKFKPFVEKIKKINKKLITNKTDNVQRYLADLRRETFPKVNEYTFNSAKTKSFSLPPYSIVFISEKEKNSLVGSKSFVNPELVLLDSLSFLKE